MPNEHYGKRKMGGRWLPREKMKQKQIKRYETRRTMQISWLHQAQSRDQKRTSVELMKVYFTRLRSLLKVYIFISRKLSKSGVRLYCLCTHLQYCILKLTDTELKDFDIKTKSMFTKYHFHHVWVEEEYRQLLMSATSREPPKLLCGTIEKCK